MIQLSYHTWLLENHSFDYMNVSIFNIPYVKIFLKIMLISKVDFLTSKLFKSTSSNYVTSSWCRIVGIIF